MDGSFRGSHQFSNNFNNYGDGHLSDEFHESEDEPVQEFGKIILSTSEQSIQLDTNELDETVLKNILYCYRFLDTTDKEYVNSVEAELYIRQIKDENPQLFELLLDVLQVASEYNPNDTNIAKNLFISRLKEHIDNLKPDDKPSFYTLRNNTNAIANYFKNLDINTRGSRTETVFEPVSINSQSFHNSRQPSSNNETYFNNPLSKMTQESREKVFNLGSLNNLNEIKGLFSNQSLVDGLKDDNSQLLDSGLTKVQNELMDSLSSNRNESLNRFENVNKFESVKDLENFLNSNENVNEYIIFNYNLDLDWQSTLRNDYDLFFNV